MAKLKTEYDTGEMMKHFTMNITIKDRRVTRFRRWAAIKIIRLAALVMGCGIEINDG